MELVEVEDGGIEELIVEPASCQKKLAEMEVMEGLTGSIPCKLI
jgi:hypothetical protein